MRIPVSQNTSGIPLGPRVKLSQEVPIYLNIQMWTELAKYRNTYLQTRADFVGSVVINEVVEKEFKKFNGRRMKKCREPIERLCDISPYFDDRAQLAYGWFALPKLMDEMNSQNSQTQWRAINSLSEYLQNPLHAQRAITEMDLIRYAQNTFLRYKKGFRTPYKNEISRLLQIFNLLSVYLNGAKKIVRHQYLMDILYTTVLQRDEDYQLVSSILRNLSEKSEVLAYLIEDKKRAWEPLKRIFKKDVCTPYYPHDLWMHLSHLIEEDPKSGMRQSFFDILLQRIRGRQRGFHLMTMKCFALLLRCERGQKKFDSVDGCGLIYGILKGPFVGNYEYVVLCLMHGVASKYSLWRCRELTDLPKILLHIAAETDNGRLQLYCLKTIRLLMAMPCIKAYIRNTECFNTLKRIKCVDRVTECTRDDVWQWLKREVYQSDTIRAIRF